jgi:hypothetical protein
MSEQVQVRCVFVCVCVCVCVCACIDLPLICASGIVKLRIAQNCNMGFPEPQSLAFITSDLFFLDAETVMRI